MWSEIYNMDYDQAVRSTAWYDIVSRRRDQDLERQLCQTDSGYPRLRSVSWLSRWLAKYRAARPSRLVKRGELEWAQGSIVL